MKLFFVCAVAVSAACSSGGNTVNSGGLNGGVGTITSSSYGDVQDNLKRPAKYNLIVSIRDSSVNDPSLDRRCFYKIFLNKVEAGRTTIGLESQTKTFEMMVSQNRQLLTVEKYVLDEKKGRYEKLNNISQPKPNYFYFDSFSDRIMRIELDHKSAENTAEYKAGFEKK